MRRPLLLATVLAWAVPGPSAHAQEAGGSAQADDGGLFVGYEPYGRMPFPLTSHGARLGYRGAVAGVEARYARSDATVLMTDVSVQEADLQLRLSLGATLHVGLGAGMRRVELAYDVFTEDGADARDSEASSERHEALIGSAQVGIEVPLAFGVVIGSDLLGVSVPLRWSKRRDDYPDEAKDFEEDPKEFPFVRDALGTCVQVARTYVGIAF